MESLIFVDSNIWCYYFDRSAQEHTAVSERMEELETRKLMTHDRAFKRLDFIEVVDPIS